MNQTPQDPNHSKKSTQTRRRTALPVAPSIEKSAINKTTDVRPGTPAARKTALGSASASVVRTQPKVYSPQYLDSNLNFPRDRRTQNMWNRNYYATNPIVRNGINLHAAYTISKFELDCPDVKIKQFFEDMLEKMDFYTLLHEITLEFWKIGECFPYLELDTEQGVWEYGLVHNPDFIRVKPGLLTKDPIITLVPDEALRKLITSNTPQDRATRDKLPPEVLYHVQRGEDIPLENFNISHIKLLSSPYDPHGTSLITSCYRDLMLFDKIREAKFVQADNFINPLTLIKLGDSSGNWKPTDDDIRQWQEQLLDSVSDQGYQIITHGMVDISKISNAGQTLDMNPDLEAAVKNIMIGMMIPSSLFDQDYGSYANASVGLEVLKARYDSFRLQLKKWIEKKVLEPIAKIQDFYITKGGEPTLIYPRVKWGKIQLKETDSYIQAVAQHLAQPGQPGTGRISDHTFFSSIDTDYDTEKRLKFMEARDQIVLKKQVDAMMRMDLNELKTLTPETPIIDVREIDTIEQTQDMTGEMGGGGEMGAPPGGGAPAGGEGGMPPLDMGAPGGEGAPPGGPEMGGGAGGMSPPPGSPPPA